MKIFSKATLFFGAVAGLTLIQARWLWGMITFEPGSLFPYVWIAIFCCLAMNISLLAVQSLFAAFGKEPFFSKAESKEIRSCPVALIYCVKNESFGLKERIRYTFGGNHLPAAHLWILSDSDANGKKEEEILIEELRQEFGRGYVFYRNRAVPYERKQGNIHDWLVKSGSAYDYFIVCDADSLLPQGWAEEVLRIAAHPENARIGVFQSAIYVTHEASVYARMQAIGQYYSQRLYFYANQAAFGRSIAFGHNCLIRRTAFETIKLPAKILSHDNWETALLEQQGYLTVFLPGIISYEEATPHYLEERKRARRWLKGTLQGFPLLFLPGISFATRFLIFYQIYLYLIQPALFFWIISGLLTAGSLRAEMFTAGKGSLSLLFFTLGVLFFHKFVVARSLGDIKRIIQETAFTTVLGLQNVFYGTLDLLILPLQTLGWTPMSKNPDERPSLRDCIQTLAMGTGAGLLLFWIGLNRAPAWTVFAMPVLTSLVLSIPAVYFSSKQWRPS